ncbi:MULTISPECIES: heme exporter protein CcmD [unclassified Undibacterium]|uniref:heme exporter protein CcmD n=1 Tax=unclassified Undibacterium TaxID=2630295 RepID=UPI002AC8D600|nr:MULTISPECIES: heme exporter protein CcmD [unclassified Undibacterium]MEB0140586.1 heme exporter protein CcmD [Undibacterium sp. CCC2.1]MEB0173640.1 heme exporter protein CcmD [Undibacterium sp. CCC1.1]MEB0177352.1 heme exporter protein CcmD [Undibacterium sp. CCC3.4]MEB0216764.1 heme exporter protein CcmD [Undibacterium sp. 5I2]WPX44557.1 heme exporter protein CcmD [Undibacterium sp. CCC3.4]
MIWHSLAEFFAMGGYALYVWSSFGMAVLLLVLEPCLLRRRYTAAALRLEHEWMAQHSSEEMK